MAEKAMVLVSGIMCNACPTRIDQYYYSYVISPKPKKNGTALIG
jgi:hypothetical protein